MASAAIVLISKKQKDRSLMVWQNEDGVSNNAPIVHGFAASPHGNDIAIVFDWPNPTHPVLRILGAELEGSRQAR